MAICYRWPWPLGQRVQSKHEPRKNEVLAVSCNSEMIGPPTAIAAADGPAISCDRLDLGRRSSCIHIL